MKAIITNIEITDMAKLCKELKLSFNFVYNLGKSEVLEIYNDVLFNQLNKSKYITFDVIKNEFAEYILGLKK